MSSQCSVIAWPDLPSPRRKSGAWTSSPHKITAVSTFNRMNEGQPELGDVQDNHRDPSSGCIVEKYRLDHARKDLGHMNVHDLWDHLWEADASLQRLSLDEQIIGELM